MTNDPIVAREKELIARVSRISRELHLSQTKAALDYLTDPRAATGYIFARREAADHLRESLQWSAPSTHVRVASVGGVVIVRELVTRITPSITVWGYVTIGRAHFPVETEDQALAYLLARSSIGV